MRKPTAVVAACCLLAVTANACSSTAEPSSFATGVVASVRVLEADGRPVVGATVQAQAYLQHDQCAAKAPVLSESPAIAAGETDQNGAVNLRLITALSPRTYCVRVMGRRAVAEPTAADSVVTIVPEQRFEPLPDSEPITDTVHIELRMPGG